MSLRVTVQTTAKGRSQIIVPLRFRRAVTGAPVADAPDIDDRGWVNHRAAGLNVDDARGTLFGAMVGDTVRLRVTREDIDDVPMFVGVSGDQVAVDQPAGGGPLPASGVLSVTAVKDTTTGTKVQIHLGTADGPVICEADAHVFSPFTLNVTPHICVIHQSAGAATGTGVTPSVNGAALDDAQIATLFETVSAIWRPAGVRFNVGAARTEVFTGFTRDDFAGMAPPSGVNEIDRVLGTNQSGHSCNLYFVRFTPGFLGLGVRFERRALNGVTHSGIIVGVEGFATDDAGANLTNRPSAGDDLIQELSNDIAHEFGHFLTCNHADNVGSPGLNDTYGRRQLMHPINLLPPALGRSSRSFERHFPCKVLKAL